MGVWGGVEKSYRRNYW